jgi:hypothetical protein
MSELRTPDELTAENELICEKLLGWKKAPWFGGWAGNWDRPDGGMCAGTPSFTTWAEAGLILDALNVRYDNAEVRGELSMLWIAKAGEHAAAGDTGPIAIRAAALGYIRSLP